MKRIYVTGNWEAGDHIHGMEVKSVEYDATVDPEGYNAQEKILFKGKSPKAMPEDEDVEEFVRTLPGFDESADLRIIVQ